MSRLTITLPQKTLQYVSSIAIRDNESLSKVINRLIQVGMHYMHAEERATPGKQYYQQLMIQSYVLIKQLVESFLICVIIVNMNVKIIHGTKSYQYIREYSQSLRNRGVIKFHHDITFGHDEIAMLMEDPEIQEHYIRHKIPVVCTDSSGRILDNGIYVNRVLEARYPESMVLFKMLRQVAQNLGSSYGNCSLHYAKNDADCQHLYSLFFDLNTDDFMHFVINNGALIQDLIDTYNFSSRDIILEAASPENRITLPNSHDYFASRGHQTPSSLNQNISVIHKITGLPMHLSQQRGRCLLHFVSGQSIREISETMQLSPKTIEHYLEILRKELGCRSSKELILHYSHQIRQ